MTSLISSANNILFTHRLQQYIDLFRNPFFLLLWVPSLMCGEGNGTPLQYSCLENPMDGGAWWAAVHGIAESDRTEWFHFHFSLSCIGEGNGNLLQCSCLENPRDGRAWWAAVHGIAQSRTWLKRLSSSSRCLMWELSCNDKWYMHKWQNVMIAQCESIWFYLKKVG